MFCQRLPKQCYHDSVMPGLTEQPCRFLCVWADAGAGSFNNSAGFPWVSPPQGCLSLSLNFGTKWSERYFSVNLFLFRTDYSSRFGSPVILQYLSALIRERGTLAIALWYVSCIVTGTNDPGTNKADAIPALLDLTFRKVNIITPTSLFI